MRKQNSNDLDHQKSQNELINNKMFGLEQNKIIINISYKLIQDKFDSIMESTQSIGDVKKVEARYKYILYKATNHNSQLIEEIK